MTTGEKILALIVSVIVAGIFAFILYLISKLISVDFWRLGGSIFLIWIVDKCYEAIKREKVKADGKRNRCQCAHPSIHIIHKDWDKNLCDKCGKPF